jgi:hypothetical protein
VKGEKRRARGGGGENNSSADIFEGVGGRGGGAINQIIINTTQHQSINERYVSIIFEPVGGGGGGAINQSINQSINERYISMKRGLKRGTFFDCGWVLFQESGNVGLRNLGAH